MSEAGIATRYQAPEIRDLGRLSVFTAFDAGGLHFAQASLGSLPGGGGVTPPPQGTTPPPGQNVLNNTQSSGVPATDVPDSSGVKDASDSGPDSDSSPSGSGVQGVGASSNGAGGGASETLPFTGMAAGPVAALGAGLTAAGATLRRRTRRP